MAIEWFDIGFDLVAELAVGEQQAGEERPERHRQAGQAGQPGRHEDGQQRHCDEYLVAPGAGDDMEQAAQHEMAHDQDQGDRQDRLHQDAGNLDPEGGAGGIAAEYRDQHEDRHDGEILEQQHGEADPAMSRGELSAFRQELQDHSRGRQGKSQADEDRRL
jgi:hypothetical protein